MIARAKQRLSLIAKTYLVITPLAIMALSVALLTKNGLENNAKELTAAHELKELAVTSLALQLTQDDASKSMLLDSAHMASDARKIKAYDQSKIVLNRIAALAQSSEVSNIVTQLRIIDDQELGPLDTSVLELFGAGKFDAARNLYFTKYEPARLRYEALLRKLGNVAEIAAASASRDLEKKNQASVRNICIALGLGIVLVAWATRLAAGRRSAELGREAAEQANRAKSEYLAEIKKLNHQLKHENTRMGAELEVTQRLQQMMLPRDEELREIPSLDISGFMLPASEIGGDYYDVISKDGAVLFGIGDVTGHGLESGVIAIMVQTAVRTLLATGQYNNRKFFDVLNRVIYDNAHRMKCDGNLTFSLLHYQDELVTISGQHEEVLIVRGNGKFERHDTLNLGFPLGLEEDISSFVDEAKVPLAAGDVMVVYTDGITEAMNGAGTAFGIDRLSDAVRISHLKTAGGIREAVLSSLQEYVGAQPLEDDISILVIKPA